MGISVVVGPFVVVVGNRRTRRAPLTRAGGCGIARVIYAQPFGHIVIDRAGVGHFLGNAEFL
jgi:hypothetical protein